MVDNVIQNVSAFVRHFALYLWLEIVTSNGNRQRLFKFIMHDYCRCIEDNIDIICAMYLRVS